MIESERRANRESSFETGEPVLKHWATVTGRN